MVAGFDRKETPVTESGQQPQGNWSEVGRRFEDLGRALRGHFERGAEPAEDETATGAAGAAEPGGAGPGGAGPGGSHAGDRAAMRDALRRLADAAQRLGEQAGEAVRDPGVRTSAQRAALTFRDALDATFTGLGDRVRGRRGSDPADAEAPSEQPPPKEIGGTSGPAPDA